MSKGKHIPTHLVDPVGLVSTIDVCGAFDGKNVLETSDIPRVLVSLAFVTAGVDGIDELGIVTMQFMRRDPHDRP